MDNNIRRLGIIIPPGNVAVEREFPLHIPPGIVVNTNRLGRPDSNQTPESILAMNDTLAQTARDLAQAYPEVIAYVCTGGSFLEGPGNEAKPAKTIEQVTGIPGVSTSIAVVEALRVLGVRKVLLVGPYPHPIMKTEVAFLRHYGFEVPTYETFECMTSEANRKLTSEQIAQRVLDKRSLIEDCDGVFISCTNILVMDQIERLERELSKPVVSSNQATLWDVLRRMKVDSRGLRGGRLFEQHGVTAAAA
ncbi:MULTISPECIES: aspartate/glutamate racemase family protein [Ramlibacter]|nr:MULTISPECIES: aspartate/glutamate racemase family protein [Ramlibacter]MBA2965026.1 aspartate/glutamate racemase family protein [Ramlibacter sp. CGMCC 1.13660]